MALAMLVAVPLIRNEAAIEWGKTYMDGVRELRTRMNRVWFWVAIGVLCTGMSARSESKTELAKRLHHAAEMNSLDDPSLKPWHLKLDVQLFDESGRPSEEGTIEEWWTPEKDKRMYATPSYTATEIWDGKTLYRTSGSANVPYLLDAVRRIVVHPFVPPEMIDKSDLELKTVAFGKTKLDCILLAKTEAAIFSTGAGMVQTYCFNKDGDQLRSSWLNPEIDLVLGTGSFQGKTVHVSSSVVVFDKNAVSERVETLSGFTPDDATFAHDSGFEDRTGGPVWLSPGEAAGLSLKKVVPKYPEKAKANHVAGTVLMEANIGKDGHIESLRLVGHSDASLSQAALDAVKDWVYKPYVVDGVAVEVQTRIKVTFSFGLG